MSRLNIDRAVPAVAGIVALLGVVLAVAVSPWLLLLAVFAAVNQLQASVSGFCPAAIVPRRLGVPRGCAFE